MAFDPSTAVPVENPSSFDPSTAKLTPEKPGRKAQSKPGGFDPSTAVDLDAFVKEKAADNKFDPIAYAHETGDKETAYQIDQARSARGWIRRGKEWISDPANAARSVAGGLKFLPELIAGAGASVLNGADVVGSGAAAKVARAMGKDELGESLEKRQLTAQAQATLAAEGVENTIRDHARIVQKTAKDGMVKAMSLADRLGLPQPDAKQTQEYLDREDFEDRLKNYANAQSLASVIPIDEGLIAKGVQKISGQKPSEMFNPEVLAASGAKPVNPTMIRLMETSANPELFAMEKAGSFPGAQTLGARAVGGVGRALQLPGEVISNLPGRLGRIANGKLATTAGVFEAALHPALTAKIGALAGTAKAFQWLGKGMEEHANMIRTGLPSEAAKEVGVARMTGGSAMNARARMAVGSAATGAASTAIGMAPMNAVLSEGDPGKFADATLNAAALGAFSGGSARVREAVVEAARPYLRAKGEESINTNDAWGRKSANTLDSMPEAQRNMTLEIMGAFQGMPASTVEGQQKTSRLLPLGGTDYRAAVAEFAGDDAPAGGGRGFFYGPDGTAYVNVDAESFADPSNAAHTMGHEFAGHVGLRMLQAASEGMHKGLVESIKGDLYKNGKPTPEFLRFIRGYNKAFGGQAIDENSPKAQEEFIAETAGQIIAGRGAADLAMPKTLAEKFQDKIGSYLSKVTGIDPRKVGTKTKFDREEIGHVNQLVSDALAQLAGMKLREGKGMETPEQTTLERVEELQEILAQPRPDGSAPASERAAWTKQQAAARAELKELDAEDQAPTSSLPTTKNDWLEGLPQEAPNHDQVKGEVVDWMAKRPLLNGGATPEQINARVDAAIRQAEAEGIPLTPEDIQSRIQNAPQGGEPEAQQTTDGPAKPQRPALTAQGVQLIAQQALIGYKPGRKSAETVRRETALLARNAIAKAHATTLPANTDLVTMRPAARGGTEITGKRIDPRDPFHAYLLREAGLTADQTQMLMDLQERFGSGVKLAYDSAPSQDEQHAAARRRAYLQNPPNDRLKGIAPSEIKTKMLVPRQIEITKGGKILIRSFSPDKMVENADFLIKAMGADSPYASVEDKGFLQDFRDVVENHAHGYAADGRPLTGNSDIPSEPDQNFTPHQPGTEKARFLNLIQGNTGAQNVFKGLPTKVAAKLRRFARENGNLPTAKGEVNPLRGKLDAAGKLKAGKDAGAKNIFQSPEEALRADAIYELDPQQPADRSGASMYSGGTGDFIAGGVPNYEFSGAGFMPEEKEIASRKPEGSEERIADFWRKVSKDDRAFSYPTTKAKSIQAITRIMSDGKASASRDGDTIRITGPNGGIEIKNASTKPEIASPEANSQGQEQGGGSLMYQIALAWAHNNRKTISPGETLSAVNRLRRTSNMLSSALRFGTTDHMEPNPAQELPNWKKGDTNGNISALANRESQLVMDYFPELKDITYDFANSRFRDSRGSDVNEVGIENSIKRSGEPGFGNRFGVGKATAKRAILTRSAHEKLDREGLGWIHGSTQGVNTPERILYMPAESAGADGASDKVKQGQALFMPEEQIGQPKENEGNSHHEEIDKFTGQPTRILSHTVSKETSALLAERLRILYQGAHAARIGGSKTGDGVEGMQTKEWALGGNRNANSTTGKRLAMVPDTSLLVSGLPKEQHPAKPNAKGKGDLQDTRDMARQMRDDSAPRKGALRKIDSGGEADIYQGENGAIYKVFRARNDGSVGWELRANEHGSVSIQESNQAGTIQKLYVLSKIGGIPSEIHGQLKNGSIIAKQPLAPDGKTVDANRIAAENKAMVRKAPAYIGGEYGIGDIYITVVDGNPYLLSDLHENNFMKDNYGETRITDVVVGELPESILKSSSKVRAEVRSLQAQERKINRSNQAFMPEESKVTGQEKKSSRFFPQLEALHYDQKTQKIQTADGREVDDRGIEGIIKESEPSGFANPQGVGAKTAKRAIWTHEILSGAEQNRGRLGELPANVGGVKVPSKTLYMPEERIESAAIQTKEGIKTGASHDEIIAENGLDRKLKNSTQAGFVTSSGQFVDRKEAARIAEKAGQLKGKKPAYLRSHQLIER